MPDQRAETADVQTGPQQPFSQVSTDVQHTETAVTDLCSFALGRGMYCTEPDGHEGDHAPSRAPVNGPPGGTIAWHEHVEAWLVYDHRFGGQSALRIAVRGGFGLWELCDQLGRAPLTWQPGPGSRERDVDGMKRLAKAALPDLRAVARDIEHRRINPPGAAGGGSDG